MRLNDADELREFLIRAGSFLKAQDDSRSASHAIGKIIEHLDRMPTVDAVPVVRCKDCKWFGLVSCAIQIVDDTDGPSEDDFCSFGEANEGTSDGLGQEWQ